MALYTDVEKQPWFQDLLRYSVVSMLLDRGKGANLYYNDEFLGMLSNGDFRGVCLNDPKFADKLLEPQFFDFLAVLKTKNRWNTVWKVIGGLAWAALVGGAGYGLYAWSLAERWPWTKPWLEKVTFSFDTGQFKNPLVGSGLVLLAAIVVGWLLYSVWTYFLFTRYGFCKKCGNFVFGKHVFNVKCHCGGWIKFLS